MLLFKANVELATHLHTLNLNIHLLQAVTAHTHTANTYPERTDWANNKVAGEMKKRGKGGPQLGGQLISCSIFISFRFNFSEIEFVAWQIDPHLTLIIVLIEWISVTLGRPQSQTELHLSLPQTAITNYEYQVGHFAKLTKISIE